MDLEYLFIFPAVIFGSIAKFGSEWTFWSLYFPVQDVPPWNAIEGYIILAVFVVPFAIPVFVLLVSAFKIYSENQAVIFPISGGISAIVLWGLLFFFRGNRFSGEASLDLMTWGIGGMVSGLCYLGMTRLFRKTVE